MRNAPFIKHNSKAIFPTVAFLLSLAAYWMTADPGPSYWDCPEYLITALRLEIGHPPGNPGWSLTHRFVTSFFTSPATQTLVVNMMSGLFTSLSVMLLCSVAISIMRRIFGRFNLAMGVASLAASLCFAFSDSVWYSAVEAEVYAMSLFLSGLTIWMSLKYSLSFSSGARTRWLVALAYVIGFSLGVHQLNLLALPAIAMIMVSGRRNKAKRPLVSRIAAFMAGCVAVVVILKGIVPGSLAMAEAADIMAVNELGMPFWSGAIGVWAVCLAFVVALALWAGIGVRSRKRWARVMMRGAWCLAAVMTGYSVYILIPVRAWANPPVNEGDPSTITRFADYLDRRQYGESPLFYGRTPESRIMRVERICVSEEGDTVYDYTQNALKVRGKDMRRMVAGGHIPERSRFLSDEDIEVNRRLSEDADPHGYAVAGFRTVPVYTPELDMFFPRIHSGSASDRGAYRDWTGMDSASMRKVRISEAIDSLGHPVPIRDSEGNALARYARRPTYLQSAAYLIGYQIGYMYLRYLMWNFSGRQNDVPATGEIDHGNFVTGLPVADNLMLGDQSALPEELGSGNAGHNVYWMIPFLLGVAGMIWLFYGKVKGKPSAYMRDAAWYILALFIMTGVAIVVYLNQSPGEPRERDYTFLGSYWAFALWIAFGMILLLRFAKRKWLRWVAVAAVCGVPVWLFAQNLDDHDRSGRSATLDYASNLLESLPKDAILFVDGDNYVFPLWYAQEVAGIRRDVSIVCYPFLGSEWYVTQLMTPRYGYDGIAMTASEGDIALGNYNLVRFPGFDSDTIAAVDALRELYADMSATPALRHRWLKMGRDYADKDSTGRWVFDLLSVPGKSAGSLAGLREVAILDIIATNAASRYPRPIYWHQRVGKNKYMGFYPYTRQALFTRRLFSDAPDSLVLTEEGLNAIPRLRWGGLDRMAYPGPDVRSQAEVQRASLIRLASALADEGRHDQALHIARMAMVRFPSGLVPFEIRHHADSAFFEARELANVLRLSGEAVGDTAAVKEGYELLREDSLRTQSFIRYRSGIPPSRRSAISPRTNNHSIPAKR